MIIDYNSGVQLIASILIRCRNKTSPDFLVICIYMTHTFSLVHLNNAGAQTFPNFTFGWVNVKDVANAHIQAYEIPSASGRYCLVESVAHYADIVKMLRELYPGFQLPEK